MNVLPGIASVRKISSRVIYFPIRLLLLSVLFLSGCATMSDDDKTKAQGTFLGAVSGIIIGGGLGALTGLAVGGSTEDVLAGAIIGGVTGGMAGGVAGYQYGMAVAQRKAYYRESEDFYLAEIEEINANTQAIESANQRLTREVAGLEKRKSALDRALADGEIERKAYRAELAGIRRDARNLRKEVRPAEEMIGYQRALLEDAEKSGTSESVADQLTRAAKKQESAYEPMEQALIRLAEVEKPTQG